MIYPWQAEQWQQLQHASSIGRLPHALLLTGMRGVGKKDFATQFAGKLLCQQLNADGYACGVCQACVLFKKNRHPNMFVDVRESPSEVIKVEQVRAMTEFVYQSSWASGYRIVMLNEAHLLNINAANALLKTLEEPAPFAIFILITDRVGQLPATILSRCQRLLFPKPKEVVALAWLKQQINESSVYDAALLLKLAEGAPLAACDWQQLDKQATRQTLFDALCQMSMGQADPIKTAAALQQIDMECLLTLMSSFMLDLLRLQLGAARDRMTNQDYLDRLSAMQAKLSSQAILNYVTDIEKVQTDINMKINLNKLLALETLFIKWCQLCC